MRKHDELTRPQCELKRKTQHFVFRKERATSPSWAHGEDTDSDII